ncbi:hypothetical protein N9Y60_02730 [Crocinitomicaceae bacterium]|nr:hypothetical protein [Crocinitomicaceae bacterium]MDB3906905.1 hypothetical protein [Crocinitomicaceae bacterium]
MKYIALITLTLASFSGFTQKSEDLVPEEAVSVLSINNINLLQKISLDELVQYRFMEELHHEITDGSTAGWTLKDSGFDFDQKMNVFQGGNGKYFVTGMTFGVKDKNSMFKIFDDFEPIESGISGVDMYASYFNRLAIQGENAIFYRIWTNYEQVSDITDSIWYSRGGGYRWDYYDDYEYYDEWEEMEEESWEEEEAEDTYPEKTYYELLDSVEVALNELYIEVFAQRLLIEKQNLKKTNPDFSKQLDSDAEGSYFINNTANFINSREFDWMKSRNPGAYQRMEEMYNGNVLSGNFYIDDNTIKLDLKAQYGSELGAIYEKLGSAKFDKNFLPYIHEDDIAYASFQADYKNAYDLIYNAGMSIVTQSDREEMVAMSITFDMLYAFLDKETLFETFKGAAFMSYKGIQKVKTKKIVFDYDEETFEYIEREEEAEEDLPIFTWGFATGNHDLIDRIMRHSQRSMMRYSWEGASRLIDHGNYWEITNGMLGSVSMYLINKNGVFIVTNDAKLAKEESNGFGSKAISKKRMKAARKGGSIYAYADMNRAIDELPEEMFNRRENEMLDVFRGKTGTFELTSNKSTGSNSDYALTYTFDSEEDSGTYILDLINSLYVISN